jgi:hypothetical protein
MPSAASVDAATSRGVALCTLLSVVWHGLWATTIPQPVDWDPAYYLDVARNIVSGAGAVTGAVWHLSGPDLPLPMPADLHWMPGPSRVLVPFLALFGDPGASLANVLMMAGQVPIAAGLAKALNADRRGILGAAMLAMLGGGYVRFGATPDSIALYGLAGGLAWWLAVQGRVGWTVAALVGAALTRGDGFLLAPAVAWVLWRSGRKRGAVVAAVSGPAAFGLWTLRNLWVGGTAWWHARAATSRALHIHALQLGTSGDPSLLDRLNAVGSGLQGAGTTALLVGVGLLPLLALGGALVRRRQPLVQAAVVYAVGFVVVTHALAPGVAASGTAFRSGAALFPVACALGALATVGLGDWGHQRRGYPAWLVPGLVGAGMLIGTVGIGWGTWSARPRPPVTCPDGPPPETPVFSGRPLLVRSTCGVMAVALFRGESAADVQRMVDLHGVDEAWLPDADPDPLVPIRADVEKLLPGWQERAPGVWIRPDQRSATAPK